MVCVITGTQIGKLRWGVNAGNQRDQFFSLNESRHRLLSGKSWAIVIDKEHSKNTLTCFSYFFLSLSL